MECGKSYGSTEPEMEDSEDGIDDDTDELSVSAEFVEFVWLSFICWSC